MTKTEEKATCLVCGEIFDSEDNLAAHFDAEHNFDDEDASGWWLLAAVPVLLWRARYAVFWILVLGAGALGALGVVDFGKDSAPERPNCAGYSFVRKLKTKSQINTFESVKPETGWNCEYSLDNEDALVRFKRTTGKQLELEIEGQGSAFAAANRESLAEGYHNAP